jgi:hypothetical protein
MRPDIRASPVFICGPARSGTTLLVRLLDSHPDLAVLPEETYVYQDLLLHRRLSWFVVMLAERLNRPALPALLLRAPFRHFAFANRERLRTRLRTWVQSFDNNRAQTDGLVDAVVRTASPSNGYWPAFLAVYDRLVPGTLTTCRYWVEKTPSNERFIALHERAFASTPRYVHVVRDPRDVVASWLKQRGDAGVARERTLVRICYLWALSVHLCRWGLQSYPSRYHPVRYEDLVRQPRNVMGGICRFLNIAPDDRVVAPTKFGAPAAPNSSYENRGVGVGIVSSQIGRFREVLRAVEIEFVERLLRQQMTACGYLPTTNASADGGPPALPGDARQSWKSRSQARHAWRLQQGFVDAPLRFASA